EFLGKNMRDVLPEQLATEFFESFHRASDDQALRIVEYSLTLHQEERWFEARIVRSGDKFLTVVRDITERKTAEEALQKSERRLRMAQQAARVGTWEWDMRSGASVWSEMIWELLGLNSGDGPSTVERFVEFIHPEDRERAWSKGNEALAH